MNPLPKPEGHQYYMFAEVNITRSEFLNSFITHPFWAVGVMMPDGICIDPLRRGSSDKELCNKLMMQYQGEGHA